MRRDLTAPFRLGLGAAGVLALIAAASGTAANAQDQASAPPPSVVVQPVRTRDVAEQQSFTGRVQAIDKVHVRARVQGFIKARPFEEGSEVKKGDLLFQLDKDTYQAALELQKANLASAQAQFELAEATYERIKPLAATGTSSQATLDQASSQRSQALASIAASKANIKKAELDLSYTDITAPMDGRVGRATYSVGELVGPESDPLVTVVMQDPMYVAFPVPQRVLLQVRREGKTAESVVVRLQLADGSTYENDGTIKFAEVEGNAGTDTVTVRAVVPNPKRLLVDQQLVGVTVVAKKPDPRLVVSQSAVNLDQQGASVLVVTKDNKVELRRVELGQQIGADIVVLKGLSADERVIISGQQKVRPGIVVDPHEPVINAQDFKKTDAPLTGKE
jgi:membrane fusion protein (multidrug efflux system)